MSVPIRTFGLALLLLTGAAHAQTAPNAPSATPNSITPPGGVARGVIQPDRPVDSKMVTQPRRPTRHNMPVIKPPGTAR